MFSLTICVLSQNINQSLTEPLYIMAYQIDYIPVGDGEKNGDAIALRFGNLAGPRAEQTVVVIDGGFKESGEALVEHIKNYYGTTHVDLVVSTHPDGDHTSGLSVVLEQLTVDVLVMHRPWEHAADIKNMFKSGRITASGLEESLEKSLQHASDLEALATKKGVKIVEAFQGTGGYNGAVLVLGPSKDFYESLLPHFRSTPAPATNLGFLAPIKKATEEAVKWIKDHVLVDLLNDDEDTTSPENNTSTIILFSIDGHKLLFTGDAGKTALNNAADYAEKANIPLHDLGFLDVPHHGSKRNLNSKILKRIKAQTAFISASKDSPKHPAKKLTNALQKHGTKVFVTRGVSLLHHYNGPDRRWGMAQAEPFHDLVEE
ncbi:MAG TPA: MBL fold metallo-hydrolase [Patescibacteria group bacterium]